MQDHFVNVKNLHVHFHTDGGVVYAVNGLDLFIQKGETLGLVGETGAGKTTTALSLMHLIDEPAGRIVKGEISFEDHDLLALSKQEMLKVRGKQITMIFQDPMSSLNPVTPVGDQVAEVIRQHERCSRAESVEKAVQILEQVGIPGERYKDYPHQFSGGMKQRTVIAIAIACNPDLLIADEPTTALDVTIQAQVLKLLSDLKEQKKMSILLITHDLGIVAQMCDRVAVMYAGEIIEYGTARDVFEHTRHPYTIGLFDSLPSLTQDVDRLKPIAGLMPDMFNLPSGCKFYDRCPYAQAACQTETIGMVMVSDRHGVRCVRTAEIEEVGH
jgi:peptide/nickel transport system ATP-binding protein